MSRDVIDLAFMVEGWPRAEALAGATLARGAYGNIVDRALSEAAQRLIDDAAHRKRCIAALRVVNVKSLTSGLRKLARRGALATAQRVRH